MEETGLRKYPRLQMEFTVELDVGGAALRERGVTLGGGGLFISTSPLPVPTGTEVMVRFSPVKNLPPIEAKAKVCYDVPGRGTGLEFTNINPDDQRRLLGFIQSKKPRRQHPRAPLVAQVEYPGAMSLAVSKDISVGGMFIETANLPSVGSRLTLRFNLDETSDILVLAAEVFYHAGNIGVGVRFIDPTPDDLKRIEKYVAATAAASTEPPSTVQKKTKKQV